MRKGILALVVTLAGCRASGGPPAEAVKQVAESLFERAARGESVPVPIPFTGQGTATPKLTKTDIVAHRRVAEARGNIFEYDVRLTYLNRIEQLEQANFTIRFRRRDEIWRPSFSAQPSR